MRRFLGLVLLSSMFFLRGCGEVDRYALDTDAYLTFESASSVPETMDRLEAAVRGRGLTVFARIDHADNAAGAGLTLAPNQVLIFGNPKAGTQLMNVDPDIGLDLPLRAVVYETSGGSKIVMHDPAALARRYGIRTLETLLGKMRETLRALANEAIKPAVASGP